MQVRIISARGRIMHGTPKSHASAAMTLDTYAARFDDDLDTVAVALDAVKLGSSLEGEAER